METRLQQRSRERVREKKEGPQTKVVNFIVRFRYIIGLIFLILIVAFNLNGSSIGEWDNTVFQRDDGKKSDVIFGQSRAIRSDEWMVQTPFYLSQAEDNFPVLNKNYGISGQNMIIAYNSPVKDITQIGKPFNWGFFFLDKDRALSFYWGFKIICMILLGFELSMILTKKNKYVSLLGSLMITFSPAVQWWFMQHVGDLIFFTLGLMVAFYHYFANHDKKILRSLMMLLVVIFGIGFVLVLYPAHQVVLAYFILFWFIGLLIHYRKRIDWDKLDIVLIIGALLFIGYVLFHFYQESKDALEATMNTLYPGRRVSTGGGLGLWQMLLFLTNWKTPFSNGIDIANEAEVAGFFNLYILVVPFMLIAFMKKELRKENYLGLNLLISSILLLVFMVFGLPESLAKLTLLSYVPTTRAIFTFDFIALLLTIWFIGFIFEQKRLPRWLRGIIVLFSGVSIYIVVNNSAIMDYFNQLDLILTALVIALIIWFILSLKKKIAITLMLLCTIASGFFVNPVVHGTGAIYEKTLAKAIMKQNQEDPGQLWIAENRLYNFLPALGVKTYNTVRFYPDAKMWKDIDPKKENEKIYNRYSHIDAYVTNGDTKFTLTNPDAFVVNINFDPIKELGVKYVVSKRSLEDYNVFNFAHFTRIYGPEKGKWQIFEVSFPEDSEGTNTEDPSATPEPDPILPNPAENNSPVNPYSYYQ
ncbi:DUF7657 domain-containing protein [Enterococcus sp. AZ163]|uniref:DUF7657 domain-containing protein n=1 Tax=Enterococcus sp. AZ163 TaxID=2774638 RepID=UPI003D26D0F1